MSRVLPASGALSMTLALVAALLTTGTAKAAEPAPAPFQLALCNPIQIVDSVRSVHGFRFSLLWGVNQDVSGLDLSTLANKANGSVAGYQGALAYNQVDGDFTGFQDSLIAVVRGDFEGMQVAGFVGSTDGHMRGFQLAPFSTAGEATGLQLSLMANQMKEGRGLQIAPLVNIADEMKGLQLGLLNFNKNGFLPFFPIFNFGL